MTATQQATALTISDRALRDCRRAAHYRFTRTTETDPMPPHLKNLSAATDGLTHTVVTFLVEEGWQFLPPNQSRATLLLETPTGPVSVRTADVRLAHHPEITGGNPSPVIIRPRSDHAFDRATSMPLILSQPNDVAQLALHHRTFVSDELIPADAPGIIFSINRNDGRIEPAVFEAPDLADVHQTSLLWLSGLRDDHQNLATPDRDFSTGSTHCDRCNWATACRPYQPSGLDLPDNIDDDDEIDFDELAERLYDIMIAIAPLSTLDKRRKDTAAVFKQHMIDKQLTSLSYPQPDGATLNIKMTSPASQRISKERLQELLSPSEIELVYSEVQTPTCTPRIQKPK